MSQNKDHIGRSLTACTRQLELPEVAASSRSTSRNWPARPPQKQWSHVDFLARLIEGEAAPAPGPRHAAAHPAGPLPRPQDPGAVRLHLANQDQPLPGPEPLPSQVRRGQGQRDPGRRRRPGENPPGHRAGLRRLPGRPPRPLHHRHRHHQHASRPRTTPAASSRNSRSTSGPTSWSSTNSAICPSTSAAPTCSSRSSANATNAAPSC